MTDEQKIEEAHGLWELATQRLSAFVESGASRPMLNAAVLLERGAYMHWQDVSRAATKPNDWRDVVIPPKYGCP